MSERPALRALATRLGIAEGYRSAIDGRFVETRDATRERLIAAMGHAAGSEAEARASHDALVAADAARLLPETRVATVDELSQGGIVLAGPPSAELAGARFRARLTAEDGSEKCWEGELEAGETIVARAPQPLGWGRYTLRLELAGHRAGAEDGRSLEQQLIVVPASAHSLDSQLGPAGGFGLTAHLYTLRRRDGWGAGDLGELRDLVRVAAGEGAAFVGLNPLHALANRVHRVCPYSPLTRLFGNPVYIEVERVPEWSRDAEAQRFANSPAASASRERLRAAERIDLPAVAALKRRVLERLYAVHLRREARAPTARGHAFERFRAAQGAALRGYATFVTIAEHLELAATGARDPWDWRTWPDALRDAEGEGVRQFQAAHGLHIEFHEWCQFELDRQLSDLGEAARRAGLGVGLCTDLALGSAAGGCDEWFFGGLFADASAGAPPDGFAPAGQDWSLPPLDPWRLRADGYRLWSRLLRAALAHAGALRLDHALALRRLFWIPRGGVPSEGAYVTYPERDLLGVLALESRRAGAAIVAEDLGTVPDGFRGTLRARGLLGSSVLLFERDGTAFRAADRYPRQALASATTHDLPPLAAWLGDEDLALRRRAGQIASDESLARSRDERVALQTALAERLRAECPGRLPPDAPIAPEALGAAVTDFLCRTDARLVALSVDDLSGETEPLNLPGVAPEQHQSWSRPVSTPPEDLAGHPLARASLDAIPPERRAGAQQASSVSSTRGISTERTTSGQA